VTDFHSDEGEDLLRGFSASVHLNSGKAENLVS
jgi:hypothetical protein